MKRFQEGRHSGVGNAVSIVDEHMYNDDTLIDDIGDCAALLSENSETRLIISQQSVNDEISTEAEKSLLDFVRSQPFLARFGNLENFEEHGLRPSIPEYRALRYNPYVAVAVARRVYSSEFESVNDDLASEFISKNMVLVESSEKSKSRFDWPTHKLTFDEYYEILDEIWSNPEFNVAAEKAIEAIEKVDGDYLDRYVWKPAREALEDIPYRAMLRHGWVSNPTFWSVIMQLKEEDFDIAEKSKLFNKLAGTDVGKFANIAFGDESDWPLPSIVKGRA